jgi:glycosyltransferase involved in cell wall biosynthesis
MRRSKRLLVLNNYPLDVVWEEVRRGEKPDHHLYGINHLERLGYEIRIISGDGARGAAALARGLRRLRNPIPLGALERQSAAWRALHEGDVIYAPCGDELNTLACLRALGLLKTPLLALQHHALNHGRLARAREPFFRMMVRGLDACPALSQCAAEEINRHCPPDRPKSVALPWGPDADFYPRAQGPGHGVLAAGRTGRDFATFGLAASRAGVDAHIIGLPGPWLQARSRFSAKVQVQVPEGDRVFGYPEMMAAHLRARAIAIPLADSCISLAGLTSLVDALAIGRPVIMTRNRFIDLDIEAEGIGRWVAPGDVAGWADALRWFDQNPDTSQAMGQRARALVDGAGWSSLAFAKRIEGLLTELPCGGT